MGTIVLSRSCCLIVFKWKFEFNSSPNNPLAKTPKRRTSRHIRKSGEYTKEFWVKFSRNSTAQETEINWWRGRGVCKRCKLSPASEHRNVRDKAFKTLRLSVEWLLCGEERAKGYNEQRLPYDARISGSGGVRWTTKQQVRGSTPSSARQKCRK